MTTKKILVYTFAIIALVFEGFFGIIPLLSFLIQVIIIACAIYLLFTIFRRKSIDSWRTTLYRYILTVLSTVGFFTSIFLIFITYHNQVPGVVSDITLSNSGQQVVFVQMSHIATHDFYEQKKSTIRALSNSGYTILFEGVKPGTPENQALFNQSIGFDFTPTLYASVANLIGLESQDNRLLYADIATGALVSVDLSLDEIMKIVGTGSIITTTGSLKNVESEILKILPTMSHQESIFIRWMASGFLNWSLKQTDSLDELIASSGQAGLFETIIDRRNDRIVEYILSHPKQKIAVVYGALHFNGVYESLQKKDKNWKSISIKNSTPYSR